jgi:multidrug efflux system membrane fusion protein
VLLYREGTAIRRPVQLGRADGDEIEVMSGLAPDDRVIVEGPENLADGQKVIVR